MPSSRTGGFNPYFDQPTNKNYISLIEAKNIRGNIRSQNPVFIIDTDPTSSHSHKFMGGNIRWGDVGASALGVLGNSFGLALGFGLALVPGLNLVGAAFSVVVVTKSAYGFGANVRDLISELKGGAPESHGALTNDIAELVVPGSQNAQNCATIADLVTDLGTGRIATSATRNSLGLIGKYGIRRVYYRDPSDLGKVAKALQITDLARTTKKSVSDIVDEM